MAVVGEREAVSGTVAVRRRGTGRKQEVMSVTNLVAALVEEVETRRLPGSPPTSG
jgi:threonyl-tRNA synthetase